jgi:hypothetical protein
MIFLLTHNTKGTTGFRFTGGQVFSEGRWRHPNGMWTLEDEVEEEEIEDIIEELSISDGEALRSELAAFHERCERHRQHALEQESLSQENARLAREKIARIQDAQTDTKLSDAQDLARHLRAIPRGQDLEIECAGGRKRKFACTDRGPSVVFYKKGGRVPWMLPCTERQLAGLMAGTMKVVYWKRTNRAAIEAV